MILLGQEIYRKLGSSIIIEPFMRLHVPAEQTAQKQCH